MGYITLEHVSKTIKNQPVLKNISLSLEKGGIYGFQGHNGSGKSMLFRVISGLVVPSEGTVCVGGKNLFSPTRSFPESIGIMIDAVGLFPYFSAVENLTYLASIRKVVDDQEIRDTIVRVGLDPEKKQIYSKYSLGMKQRLIIAQAILEKPELLIFDEPTNALDEDGVEMFRKIVLEENQRGATILISSHRAEDLEILCQKIYTIHSGAVEDEVV